MSAAEHVSHSFRESTPGIEAPDHCPTCDQVVPPDKVAQVKGRLVARDHALTHELTAKLQNEFARSRQQDQILAQQALEDVRKESALAVATEREQSAAREQAARDSALSEAAASFAQQSAEQAQRFEQTLAAQHEQVKGLEESRAALLRDAERAASDLAAANARVEETENRVRIQLTAELEAKAAANVADLVQQHQLALQDSETKHAEATASHQTELRQLKEALSAANQTAEQQIAAVQEASRQREAAVRAQTDDALGQLAAVKGEHQALSEQLQTLKEGQATAIAQAVQETREALEKDKTAAVAAEQAKSRDETQKLITKLEDTKRQLEKKTAEELGEGAELDLFEELKARFENDIIRRVPKGTAGADVIHEIRENGVVCGKIVYDSKNRKDWKTEYATKLRTDQIAERADHAVLSSNKFPAGFKQLHIHEHVVIACPARVLAVSQMLRDSIVHLHTLRVSNESRDEKTQQLYAFMTSARCSHLFDSVNSQITKLEEIDEAEATAHQKTWEKRGSAIKSLEKAHGNLRFEVQRIVGAADGQAESQQ
jgi:hypothetical protein